jgi:3-oxoacyl-[acyl-carrier protein] reductase
MSAPPLAGRNAVVTGAGSGIGRASLAALRAAGAQAVGVDVTGCDQGGGIVADVSVEADSERAMAEAADRLGAVHILVNAAGIFRGAPLATLDIDDLDRLYAVNVRGTVLMTKAALRYLGEAGRIINIASELAYLGRAGASAYCATKGAILSLTRSWARELAPGILVNAIAPGPVDTPLLAFESLSEAERVLETANPLGRIGKPHEIASAVVFLASPQTGFLTGQCLSVDGGAAMH